MTTLTPGIYNIRSKLSTQLIGRSLAEDLSLNPKEIINLPENIESERQWQIKILPNHHFLLLAKGDLTTAIDNRIFAILQDGIGGPPREWIIEARPQHGSNVYTIAGDDGKGWTLSSTEEPTQVTYEILVSTKSLPPQFRDRQLWVITPAS